MLIVITVITSFAAVNVWAANVFVSKLNRTLDK